jgi:hypothetical protein
MARARKAMGVDSELDRAYMVAMSAMSKAVGKWFMVLSLCAAIGLHWAALQSVAWVGMLITYSHSASVATAVSETFDGDHPCPLCKAIHKAEQSGRKQDIQLGGRIDMDYPRQIALLIPPTGNFSWPAFVPERAGFSPEPSVPPPRAV